MELAIPNRWHYTWYVLIPLVLAGCVPIPPKPVSISEVPIVSGPSCTFTIVRRRQFAGSAPTHYISLDGVTVASLEVGEYTMFPVSEGHHLLAVTWHVGDKLHGVGGFGAGVAVLAWSPHSKLVEANCQSSTNYSFTITSRAFAIDENDRVEVKAVDRLKGEFSIDQNTYVSPGMHKPH